jgi:peroxiredoxin
MKLAMPATIGQAAADFTLSDLSGMPHTLSTQRGAIVVVNFWSAECPWSRRADAILAYKLAAWSKQGVLIWGIASNASEPEREIRAEVEDRRTPYPVLLDPGNRVADLYAAISTPHFYLVDAGGVVRYIGALDDATFRKREPKTFYLDDAINAVLEGRAPEPAETPAYGCAIVRVVNL